MKRTTERCGCSSVAAMLTRLATAASLSRKSRSLLCLAIGAPIADRTSEWLCHLIYQGLVIDRYLKTTTIPTGYQGSGAAMRPMRTPRGLVQRSLNAGRGGSGPLEARASYNRIHTGGWLIVSEYAGALFRTPSATSGPKSSHHWELASPRFSSKG